jgi:hypothetical protein
MQWDALTDQWFLFASGGALLAALIAIVVGLGLYRRAAQKQIPTAQNDQDGWNLTGRIDFADVQSTRTFILQVEETRIGESIGGVERREIRWRKATLDEAKTVLVAYHTQRNLMMTANFVVSSLNLVRRSSEPQSEQKHAPVASIA